MSIFGDLDADTVSSNPFFIEAGEYPAEVILGEFRFNRDNVKQIFFQFHISDEDSAANGQKPQLYLQTVEEGMTREKLLLLPATEQAKIKRTAADLKRALCGDDGNKNRPGMGIDPNDLNNKDWNPSVCVGLKGTLVISNFGPGNTGVQIRYFNIPVDDSDAGN